MKTTLSFLLLIFSLFTYSQSSNKDMSDQTRQLVKQMDSIAERKYTVNDSAALARDLERNTKNLDNFLQDYQERERKAKQGMWMRLGFGILLAVIGIYGILRKKRAKQ